MYLIFLGHIGSHDGCLYTQIKFATTLSCSLPHTESSVSYKNELMHTYIIHSTLLALYYSNMFCHSKGHLQGVRHTFSQPDQQNSLLKCTNLCIAFHTTHTISNFLNQEFLKILIYMAVVGYMALIVPHAI